MVLNDRVLGAAALVVAAFLAWYGHDLEAPFAYEPVGPRAFPMLVAAMIASCGVWLVVKGGNPTDINAPGATARIALMVAVVAAYAVAFQWLGFVTATTFMTVLVGRLFGGTWLKGLWGGAVMGLGFFLLFDKALDVVLPTGLLGGLL